MVVKTRPLSKSSDSYPGIYLSNNWQKIKFSPCLSLPVKRRDSVVMSRQASVPERPETATLEKPSILDPNLSKKIDMTILSRENLKYVNNLVVKPIPKKASLEEQTLALNSLTAGLNTISGPNSLIISTNSAESNRSGPKKSSPFNPITLESPKNSDSANSTQISPAFRPSRGKTVLLENKPKVVAQKKSNQEEASSKLSKLYKVINKNYRIRTSFRRGKDKSNTSRSSSRCETSNQDETPNTAKQVKPELKNEKAPHSGKSKKSGKKASHKEKKYELNVAQKSAVRKPFAAKFKGRSRSLKRTDENSTKGGKKEVNKDRNAGKEAGGASNDATASLKVPAKNEKPETGSGNELRKTASPSSSHIPVRKGKAEFTSTVLSGPASLTVEDLHPVTRNFENGYSLTEWIPVPPSSGRKPRLITCRFCSREFGTASFPVHEPRCMRIWLGEHNSNKENKTENCFSNNQPLDQSSSTSQNKESTPNGCQADKTHKTATRIRQGTPKPGTAKRKSVSVVSDEPLSLPISVTSSPGTPSGRRPPTVLCHICNREFGSKSIAIHEPQCLHKWKLEQDKQNRRKQSTSGDKENKLMQDPLPDDTFWESHRQQLVPCKKCSRTFNPDRVVVHERSCKGRIPKKKK